MVKTGGGVFATPRERSLFPQQVEIAALHQLHTGVHQANGPVAQVMRLPAGTRRNARVAEQARRNDAIGLARKAPIERTERKTKVGTVVAASVDLADGRAVGRQRDAIGAMLHGRVRRNPRQAG